MWSKSWKKSIAPLTWVKAPLRRCCRGCRCGGVCPDCCTGDCNYLRHGLYRNSNRHTERCCGNQCRHGLAGWWCSRGWRRRDVCRKCPAGACRPGRLGIGAVGIAGGTLLARRKNGKIIDLAQTEEREVSLQTSKLRIVGRSAEELKVMTSEHYQGTEGIVDELEKTRRTITPNSMRIRKRS